MIIRRTVLCIAFLLSASPGHATIRRVPADYATIQAAINASASGDTVLVARGAYIENINFRGKNLHVASEYLLTPDPNIIIQTIIDGSAPSHPDTASCVLMVSGEDSSAVLEGFTLTAGRGTKWLDEHGAGLYREGGGILVTSSSPTIRNNLIIDNEAINSTGCVSAGGGGIRCGDAAVRLTNNVIVLNRAMYGAGIVLNYCSGAIVRNNLIVRNDVYQAVPGVQTFGGGGIWIFERHPSSTSPNLIENNTIIGNSSAGDALTATAGAGGGILIQAATIIGRNNIIRANRQMVGGQISGPITLTFSDVLGGYPGNGNIDADPLFSDSSWQLTPTSVCADAGDPAPVYNDPEDPFTPGQARWPSVGTTRNDMGAYGGPHATELAPYTEPGIFLSAHNYNFGLHLPGSTASLSVPVENIGSGTVSVSLVQFVVNPGNSVSVSTPLPFLVRPASLDSLSIVWTPTSNFVLQDTALLYHNDPRTQNPLRVFLQGNSNPTPALSLNTADHNFGSVDVNIPRRDTTFMVYNVGTGTDSVYVSLDYKGLQPPSGIAVSPKAFQVAPGDSQGVTFTFYPPLITRSGLNNYAPVVLIDSRFGLSPTRFQKTMKFRLTGTLSIPEPSQPMSFSLGQNYPNPFNPTTVISFQLPEVSDVRLSVFDLLGREVAVLVNDKKAPGSYDVTFNAHLPGGQASGLASSVYIYQLEARNARGNLEFRQVRRMVLIK